MLIDDLLSSKGINLLTTKIMQYLILKIKNQYFMTETLRTTVTLSKISMDQVNELIGVFGNTPAAVISRIVEHFFDYGKFDDVLNRLVAKKRDLYPPDEKTIGRKIDNLFKGANKIPLEEFIGYLEISKKYIFNNIHKWKEKYQIQIIENLVVKSSE